MSPFEIEAAERLRKLCSNPTDQMIMDALSYLHLGLKVHNDQVDNVRQLLKLAENPIQGEEE